ncbi:hypothetical protein AXG93_1862s1390 [Marchantia polymorpha subsp. ruderalis]|uniref:Uncharacterized protein n=1 Tax=Marchantia polymorpha subsp. ruderalis TaxID=1480154 RepID=A0A176W9D9_MARPO|nr:hypothetical protein AXG93_1862s1390 [Marchantia polymorpha subsp. ruderalis]
MDYIDLKRRAIALEIMHILRPAHTTYVTAWQTTTRGPVQVDVVRRREKPERRLAKRRKVVSDDEEDLALEVKRTETEVDVIRQSRTRAVPKKRANRGLVAAEVSDSSVEKTIVPIVSTSKVTVGESTQLVEIERPSGVLIEVPADAPAEPLKERMEILSPNSLSSERIRHAGSEETSHSKTSEELVKELTLSDEVLEQVVT